MVGMLRLSYYRGIAKYDSFDHICSSTTLTNHFLIIIDDLIIKLTFYSRSSLFFKISRKDH